MLAARWSATPGCCGGPAVLAPVLAVAAEVCGLIRRFSGRDGAMLTIIGLPVTRATLPSKEVAPGAEVLHILARRLIVWDRRSAACQVTVVAGSQGALPPRTGSQAGGQGFEFPELAHASSLPQACALVCLPLRRRLSSVEPVSVPDPGTA